DRGLTIVPTQTRESAKPADILVVPGGPGIDNAMLDNGWIAYARREAAEAKYVFSVCTGSLLLAAAGLLTGRRAGGHWQARDPLNLSGEPARSPLRCNAAPGTPECSQKSVVPQKTACQKTGSRIPTRSRLLW